MIFAILGVVALIIFIIAGIASKNKILAIVGVIAAIVLIGVSCVAIVPTGHTGVVTEFGKVQDYTLDAGFHIKAPWHSVINMDNRVQKESTELSCFSSDIQEVAMVYTINYQIRQADAMTLYATIGRDYYNTVIVPCITESVKAVTAKYSAENLIGNRTELAQVIEDDLAEKLDEYNIILVSTSIEDMDFTDEFTSAVEAKQVAQQNKLKSETEADQRRIEAQAAADAQVIAAQGEADALRIQAEAEADANTMINKSLSDNILQKMYYDNWNGILPSVVGSESIVLMPNQNTEE